MNDKQAKRLRKKAKQLYGPQWKQAYKYVKKSIKEAVK